MHLSGESEATLRRDLHREEIRTAWRAVLTYRRELSAAREDRTVWSVAYAARREVLPEMPEAQAKLEITHAIAYAAANHAKWFGAASTAPVPPRTRCWRAGPYPLR
jgi:hypothetical protein